MSYRGSGYRGPQGDRSRSPPRFSDRRPSNASVYDGRHNNGPPPRNSDAPRGPRSQFDGPPLRGPPPGGLNPGGPPRTLRDAPPLGSGPRPFRERDFSDRRPSPPPRDRSPPPRKFNESRDFPPRDIDIRSARRASRDGPPSAGSNYSDNPPFSASSTNFRGGFGRGRGRGDFEHRGGIRGGRRAFDDRPDLFRRERSPPPRFGRDLSREGREPERREERRFDRREDDRRPEWLEREREIDRARRDAAPGRPDARSGGESAMSNTANYQASQAPPINPERLAIIESSGADTSIRRQSTAQGPPATRDTRREPVPETPSYLNGRAETTANRYGSRGSSPPTQAPPVPAFSFSVGPTSGASGPPQAPKAILETRHVPTPDDAHHYHDPIADERPAPPFNPPTAPKAAPPVAPKAFHASPPPTAPKAPRALGSDPSVPPANRLQGVRSMENLPGSNLPNRHEGHASQSTTLPPSPNVSRQSLSHQGQPAPSMPPQAPRHADLSAPTGPKATRNIISQSSISPRPPFVSPRVDAGAFQPITDPLLNQQMNQRGTTPPSAPSGPRNRSFSVSPKIAASSIPSIPTGPKAARVPSIGHGRAPDRPLPPQSRAPERSANGPPFAPPPGPRAQTHWTWTRPGAYGSKPGPAVPAKRDSNGEEKDRQSKFPGPVSGNESRSSGLDSQPRVDGNQYQGAPSQLPASREREDRMDIDSDQPQRRPAATEGHSAKQSFFGKTLDRSEDLIDSSSEEDELDEDEDATLLEAKHKRKERELRAQMFDLSAREYRATSPLESIARLARLSAKDMERLNDQHEDAMDVDIPEPEPAHNAEPRNVQPSESDDGPEISTPQGEDGVAVVVRESEDAPEVVRRYRRPSPEIITLPYLLKGEDPPLIEETETFRDNVAQFEDSLPDVMALVKEELQAEDDAEEEVAMAFEEHYRRWREDCDALDRAKEQQEKLERQQSLEPGPESDAPMGPLAIPTLEGLGRRAYKNSSEYEIEQVLKQSEETARIEQEKLDREARKVQADMEKEARLPDQQTADGIARTMVVDTNRLRDPDALTMVFTYEPPIDDFTEEEQQIFVAAFKDTPKKWGEIASLLPGRTYKDCIAHYYANKWDGRFRDNRAKKFKGGRRGGRGKGRPTRGSALMADLNRGEELIQATTDSATGRPKRAAAPTTFGEREMEAKSSLVGQSPAKKLGPGNGEPGAEKPAKKQRRTGELKPGRKGKSQLAALAAAPTMTPNKSFAQGMPSKDELQRNQKLEEANLLMNVGNHPGMMHHDARGFSQEAYAMHANVPSVDDYERSKPSAPSAKQGASSYWSVPEQTDFFKYIAHFGTDFAAIANHMGTKTQTMIKNHYTRQVEGGRSELEVQANQANARRDRGEDIGPPPTPTPIIKRKYDNPQTNTPRSIAPQADPMDTDELLPGPAHPATLPKHTSPPQYAPKPRYPPSTQSTPVAVHRAVPSPLPASSTPTAAPLATVSLPRGGLQHPLGSRFGSLGDTRAESRSGAQPTSAFRMAQESNVPSRSQPSAPKLSRTLSNAPDPQFMQNLVREQEKAMRLQAEYRDGRVEDVPPRPGSMQLPHSHGSPANQHMPAPMDRKVPVEERAPTPPRNAFMPPGMGRPPAFSPSGIPPMTGTPLSAFAGRGQYHPSPKSDFMRPGSVMTSAPSQHPSMPMSAAASAPKATPTPAPEPPKRSTLLDILNNDPEETKPAPKRESLTSAPTRVASPAPPPYHSASTPQTAPSILPPSRRETFGQPSMGQTHFHRSSFGQQGSSTPGPVLKHEHASSGSATHHAPQQEWQARLGQSGQPSPPAAPPLDRDMRPSYLSHRSSMLGPINPTRVNSPPPQHMMGHSRTSSLTGSQPAQPPRESRNVIGDPPQSHHQSSQGLHASPYGHPHQPSPFSQPPPQPSSRAMHSHSGSLGGDPNIIQRFGSNRDSHREDLMRREGEMRAQQDRDDQRLKAIEAEKQAEQHHRYQSQRQNEQRFQEQEMERQRLQQQQGFSRGPPPQMAPSFSSPFGPGQHRLTQHQQPMGGLREMSMREADAIQQEEQHRRMHHHQQQHQDNERRRQEQQQQQQQQQQQPPFMRDRDPQGDQFRRRPPFGGYGPPMRDGFR